MKFKWSEMSWFEIEDYFSKMDIAILPTGAIHAHDHLPVGVDCMVITEIAEKTGERTGVIVAPTISFGWLPTYDEYPGSLCIKEKTFKHVVLEVCEGLIRSGAKKIIFLNGHSGNESMLDSIALILLEKANALCPTFCWYSYTSSLADYEKPKIEIEEGLSATRDLETSILLAIRPPLANLEKARVVRAKKIYGEEFIPSWYKGFRFRGNLVRMYTNVRPLVEYGEYHTEATEEKGNKIFDATVDFFAEFINEFKRVRIPQKPDKFSP